MIWRFLAALSMAYFAGTTAVQFVPHEVLGHVKRQAACHIAMLAPHAHVLTQSLTEIG